MTKQDITKSVAICTDSVETFWDISLNATDEYTAINVCHVSNPIYFPSGITIHKGYGGEKDWRICGAEWKKLYSDDNPEIGDIMLVRKLGYRRFSVEIIKKDSPNYEFLSALFSGNDNYVMLTTGNSDNFHFFDKDRPLQQIYYGAPGTGKSYTIDNQTNETNSIRTTFHPDTDYATFVGAYKPMMEIVDEYALDATGKTHQVNYPNGKKSIVYDFEPQVFIKAYVEAWKRWLGEEEDKSYYLIIEEINRGNCAQIFGDLFQLLDREDNGFSSYSISPNSAITKYLSEDAKCADGTNSSMSSSSQYDVTKNRNGIEKIIVKADELSKGEKLVLPPNLYIWATMNTSDQSLFPIDSAFKRRWTWKYVPIKRAEKEPEKNWIVKVEHDGAAYWCYWWEFLEAINHQIEETTHSEDKQLGYFFAKPKAGENFISADTLVNKVIFYLWNDVFKDEDNAIFQYGEVFEDVDINRSGNMYFRHFMECPDKMVHYFINQLFGMGKDYNPVVPIDYAKKDKNPTMIEHLPKMRMFMEEVSEEDSDEESDDADSKNNKNTDRYIVDDDSEAIGKNKLLTRIVEKQIERNPAISVEVLKDTWNDLKLNSQHCILDDSEYRKLVAATPSYEGRYNQVPNKGIWVNNQIGGEDTATTIIERAKKIDISVEKVK